MDQSSLKTSVSEIDLEWGDTKGDEYEDEKLKSNCANSTEQLDKRLGFDVNVIKGKKLPDELKEEEIAPFLAEKKTSCKCPVRSAAEHTRFSKPPRPPTGPSMDAADRMLVKEISELAILKRKRIERMKTLHKMKKEKKSSISSSSSLVAMIVTLIFFILIIWQGKTFL